ncbi:hypothetical protein [Saccharothrix lopnurensis]|uniref:Uncharacterized protein n=1 Tax=Saccharothrix lopnurensis TaxID=1670621 RepID=A0ABW1PC33_9PSEU
MEVADLKWPDELVEQAKHPFGAWWRRGNFRKLARVLPTEPERDLPATALRTARARTRWRHHTAAGLAPDGRVFTDLDVFHFAGGPGACRSLGLLAVPAAAKSSRWSCAFSAGGGYSEVGRHPREFRRHHPVPAIDRRGLVPRPPARRLRRDLAQFFRHHRPSNGAVRSAQCDEAL